MKECPVKTLPFWANLTTEQQRLLCMHTHFVHYQAGQVIGSSNVECLGMILIQTGALRICFISEDGRQVTVSRVCAGEVSVLPGACALSSITFNLEIDVEENCEAFIIPAEITERLMKENIYAENYFYRFAVEAFSDVISVMERILFHSLEQRLVAFLLDESARQHTDLLKVTQEHLAQNIGSAREAVTRAIKRLSQKGYVKIQRGMIEIIDKNALYQICK